MYPGIIRMYAQVTIEYGNAERIPHILPLRMHRPNRKFKRPTLWYTSENGKDFEYFSPFFDKVKYSKPHRYVHWVTRVLYKIYGCLGS